MPLSDITPPSPQVERVAEPMYAGWHEDPVLRHRYEEICRASLDRVPAISGVAIAQLTLEGEFMPPQPSTTAPDLSVTPDANGTYTCTKCGKESDDAEDFKDSLCKTCWHELYFICDRCDDRADIEDMQMCEACGDTLCPDCWDRYHDTCPECGETVCKHNQPWEPYEGTAWHADCLDREYSVCDRCGNRYDRDDMFYCARTHEIFCPCCYSIRSEDDEDQTELSNGLHEYSYKPSPKFFHTVNTPPQGTLYFGIELEVEAGYRPDLVDGLNKKYGNYVYLKEDASLDTITGVEIVSHPADWKWLRTQSPWSKILQDCKDNGAVSYATGNCGLHVHISKDAFTTFHLYKFLMLVYKYPETTIRISQRGKETHYANFCDDRGVAGIKTKAIAKRGDSHYAAVNLENKNTVEVRIFRGTIKESSFWKDLEWCHAAYLFARDTPANKVTPWEFLKWVETHCKEYPNLYKFMIEKNVVGENDVFGGL